MLRWLLDQCTLHIPARSEGMGMHSTYKRNRCISNEASGTSGPFLLPFRRICVVARFGRSGRECFDNSRENNGK